MLVVELSLDLDPPSSMRSKSVAVAILAHFSATTTEKTNGGINPHSKRKSLCKAPCIGPLSYLSHVMDGGPLREAHVVHATPPTFTCKCKQWLSHTSFGLCLCTLSMVETGTNRVEHRRTATVWLVIHIVSSTSRWCNRHSW